MTPLRIARGLAGGASAWASLAARDRGTYASAWWTLLVTRLKLRLFRTRAWDGAQGLAEPLASAGPPDGARRLIALFRLAARRHVASFSCLPRAIALRRFLRAHRVDAALRLGVRRTAAGIEGHAWVEIGGVPLQGEAAFVGSFVPLRWAGARLVEEAR